MTCVKTSLLFHSYDQLCESIKLQSAAHPRAQQFVWPEATASEMSQMLFTAQGSIVCCGQMSQHLKIFRNVIQLYM